MEKNKYVNCNPSALRITTHSAKSRINSNINLENVAKNLGLDTQIVFFKFKNGEVEHIKGINPKKTSKKKKKGKFYNQMTIVVQPEAGFFNNVKLFRNGSISMTGIKKKENGVRSIQIILDKMKLLEADILDNKDACKVASFDITLINSDYEISFEIKRSELQNLLVNKYKIYSSYEPCIYPGVNSKFYWNKSYKDKPFIGKCYCSDPCTGKGNGEGNGNCKKITIAIFQSGSIIITGARCLEQIYSAYHFINNVLEAHADILQQKNAPFLETEDTVSKYKIHKKEKHKNTIYIKKDNIKNMPNMSVLEKMRGSLLNI